MKLESIKKIYFVGIGGIGMSALARYFNSRQVEVYGYDRISSPLTEKLESEGMQIHYEEAVHLIPEGIDLVVYTPAVPNEHAELQYFWNNNYQVLKRAAVLGIISRGMKAIAIGGTHGKTTTTSITTHILKTSGIDCTAFLGGIAENFQSNFVEGKSEWFVVEADEFDRSFLHLNPQISAVLSMDADHLDIYGNEQMMHQTFDEFVNKTNHHGTVVFKKGLPLTVTDKMIDKYAMMTFGHESGDFQIKNVRVENGYFVFDVASPIENIDNLAFTLPGKHNALNSLVGIAIAQQLGASSDNIRTALKTFKGIKRRFEFVVRGDLNAGQKVFIDDYAHHPSELNAAIDAARQMYPNRKLTGIFQPHLYSRTNDFQDGFAAALDELDEIYLLEIYPARELPMKGVTSEIIFNKMKNPNKHLVQKSNLLNELQLNGVEVLITLGAGDIDRLILPIKALIER
jgi:UDP-N-acetylmuramate--alanine ligase